MTGEPGDISYFQYFVYFILRNNRKPRRACKKNLIKNIKLSTQLGQCNVQCSVYEIVIKYWRKKYEVGAKRHFFLGKQHYEYIIIGKNCRQISLLILTLFIDKFVYHVGLEGIGCGVLLV